jgi:sulfur carrier protein
MKVRVNGRDTELPAGATVADLITGMALASRRVAVEVNRTVVARNLWAAAVLVEQDQIEVVQFVGGG